ncbi:MAG: fibronectin type III domain-containing protein [Myxococcota bacterium]
MRRSAARLALGALVTLCACDSRTSSSRPDDTDEPEDPGELVIDASPSDASLSRFMVRGGVLSTPFRVNETRYTILVESDAATVSIEVEPTNPAATLSYAVDGETAADLASVRFASPATLASVTVLSADGQAERTYRATIRLEPADEGPRPDPVADPPDPLLAAPAGFRVTGVTPTSVALAWDAVEEATNYTVFRDIRADGPFATVVAETTSTTVVDAGLGSGLRFYYLVRASSASRLGEISPALEAMTLVDPDADQQLLIAAVALEPSSFVEGVSGTALLTATIDTIGEIDIQDVTADLTAIDGPAELDLFDDGRLDDAVSSDGVFSGRIEVADSVAPGTYEIPVAAEASAAGRMLSSDAAAMLTVRSASQLEIVDASVAPALVFNKAADPRDVTLSVEVDASGGGSIDSVTADLSPLGGDASESLMLDVGSLYTLAFEVPVATAVGDYDIAVAAVGTDSGGGALMDNSSVSLTVGQRYTVSPPNDIADSYVTLADGVLMPEALSGGSVDLDSPFAISFYGQAIDAGSTVTVRVNGTIGISTPGIPAGTAPSSASDYLALLGEVSAIAAFHHEPLAVNATASPAQGVYARLDGMAPERTWTVEWQLSGESGMGRIEVQLVFFESPGVAGADFELRYGTMNVPGMAAYSIATFSSIRSLNTVVVSNPMESAPMGSVARRFTY